MGKINDCRNWGGGGGGGTFGRAGEGLLIMSYAWRGGAFAPLHPPWIKPWLTNREPCGYQGVMILFIPPRSMVLHFLCVSWSPKTHMIVNTRMDSLNLQLKHATTCWIFSRMMSQINVDTWHRRPQQVPFVEWNL